MIDFFSTDTANGQKVAIMLEETGLPYRLINIDLTKGEHREPSYLSHNPEGRVPAIVDPEGPGGDPLALSQTLAIVRYLARKSGKLLPTDAREEAEADRYMALVSSDLAGAFTGLFYFGRLPVLKGHTPDEAAVEHFTVQAHRGLKVLDRRLDAVGWLTGVRMTLADVLALPVATSSIHLLPGDALADYPALRAWRDRMLERPMVVRGLAATKRPGTPSVEAN